MFEQTSDEWQILISQIVISSWGSARKLFIQKDNDFLVQ